MTLRKFKMSNGLRRKPLRTNLALCAVTILGLCIFAGTCFANSKEDNASKVVSDLKRVKQATQGANLDDLHQRFEKSESRVERQMSALSLGIHYLDKDTPRSLKTALQYLTIAEASSEPGDLVVPIISFYRASARLKGGASREAAMTLGQLLKGPLGAGWERAAWSLYVESLHRSGNYSAVVDAYTEYTKRFSPSRREQDVAQHTAMVLEKKGEFNRVVDVLEELAGLYPMSAASRWAFEKLLDYSCETGKGKQRYVWSRDMLLRLSRNTTLESGLKQFIIARLSAPIAVSQREIRVLLSHEKAEFFLRSKFFEEAAAEAQAIIEMPDNREPRGVDRARGLILLGRAHAGMNDHVMATRYFSLFIEEFPGLTETFRARELMADSLNRLRHFKDAAFEYEKLAATKGYGNPLLMWHHFWNTYLSGDYAAALSMLDVPGYVPPRDRNEPAGLPYWRARILEKLGKKDEAQGLYEHILKTDGESYYAMLVATRFPAMAEKSVDSTPEGLTPPAPAIVPAKMGASMDPEAESYEKENVAEVRELEGEEEEEAGMTQEGDSSIIDEPEFGAFSAKLRPRSGNRKKGENKMQQRDVVSPELRLVDDLIEAGLMDQARTQLRGMSWRDYSGAESMPVISRISWMLNDYRANLQAPYRAGSSLRSRPKSWKGLVTHQRDYSADWKVYYPLAHERVVRLSSKRINISQYFVLSIMRAESHYNAEARSPVGALGLMQIMPFTGVRIAKLLKDSEFEVSGLKSPELSIPYGAYYLKKLLNYFGGNPMLAIASYNAGPIAVRNWIEASKDQEMDEFVESIPYLETRRYVKSVLRNYSFYKRIYENDHALTNLPPLPANLPDGEEIF